MLLDSNIVIYAVNPAYANIKEFLRGRSFSVSALTKIEVMGFWRLSEDEHQQFNRFFQALEVIAVSPAVVEQAIALRRQKRIGLADAVIAATALTQGLPLVTHNSQDFQWIDGLEIIDPVSNSSP